jgi:hypothetical protein
MFGEHSICDRKKCIQSTTLFLTGQVIQYVFLDALCEAFLEKVLKKEIQPEYGKKRLDIAIKWISKPTNERLNFLFEEFSHLL